MNRELSGYAFNQYGNDAILYNGIHDLETKLESADEELKKRAERIAECLRLMKRYTEDDGWPVYSQSVAQEAIDALASDAAIGAKP